MSPVVMTLAILASAIVAFISNRVPLGIVAIGVSVALWLTGILDLRQLYPVSAIRPLCSSPASSSSARHSTRRV